MVPSERQGKLQFIMRGCDYWVHLFFRLASTAIQHYNLVVLMYEFCWTDTDIRFLEYLSTMCLGKVGYLI